MSLLSRYILGEVLKVMLLACGVLVSVIAFGAAIRPLAQNLLGPVDLMKYVGLASVPMLQFALPFAAGFAATVALHRLASDNEIQAMSVSGLSYRRILRPIGVLGALLAVVMLILVFSVVPRFWVIIQNTITRDATRLFVATVQDGRAFARERLQIYADEILEVPPPAGSDASSRLLMAGVAAIERGEKGGLETEFTAELATVDVYRTAEGTFLKPVLVNASIYRDADAALINVPRAEPDAARITGRGFAEPKYMTIGQMADALRNPTEYPPIVERLDGFDRVLREAATWRVIAAALDRGGLRLDDALGRRHYVIRGAGLRSGRPGADPPGPGATTVTVRANPDEPFDVPLVAVDGAGFSVTEFEAGVPTRTADASAGTLAVAAGRAGQAPIIELTLVDPVSRAEPGAGALLSTRWPQRLSALSLHAVEGEAEEVDTVAAGQGPGRLALGDVVPSHRALAESLADAPGPSGMLRAEGVRWVDALEEQVNRLQRDVIARSTQRLALTVSAPLLLMLGAVLAIWRRESTPLEIYLIAFIPAIVNIMLISSGEQMLKGGRLIAGELTAWSGNAILALVVAGTWWRMGRH